jgi:hypothetical protein
MNEIDYIQSDLNGNEENLRPLSYHSITYHLDQIAEGIERFGLPQVKKSLKFYFSKGQVDEIINKVKEWELGMKRKN